MTIPSVAVAAAVLNPADLFCCNPQAGSPWKKLWRQVTTERNLVRGPCVSAVRCVGIDGRRAPFVPFTRTVTVASRGQAVRARARGATAAWVRRNKEVSFSCSIHIRHIRIRVPRYCTCRWLYLYLRCTGTGTAHAVLIGTCIRIRVLGSYGSIHNMRSRPLHACFPRARTEWSLERIVEELRGASAGAYRTALGRSSTEVR